jgi:hypothetical protein
VDGQAARHQEVPPVAVLDLYDVAGAAEATNLMGEDELHLVTSSQRAVLV